MQVAGLQDFRGAGPPGDTGTYQMPCTVLVFQWAFSGTTYYAAVRAGDRGWIPIGNNQDAVTVINLAIAALPVEGGEVFVCAARYYLANAIAINRSNVNFSGVGYGTYFYLNNNVSVNIIYLYSGGGASVQNVHISDIRCNGNYLNQVDGGNDINQNCICCRNVINVTIENCWLTAAYYHGIMTTNTVTEGLTYTENCVYANREYGINFFDGPHRAIVSANKISDQVNKNAIHLNDGCYDFTISDNVIWDHNGAGGTGMGIHLLGDTHATYHIVVSGNTINTVSGDGVRIDGSNGGVNDILVEGNIIRTAGLCGVFCRDSNYVRVIGNWVYDPVGNGAEFDDADYCSCTNNQIYSAGGTGILYGAGAVKILFQCNSNFVIASASTNITIAMVDTFQVNGNFTSLGYNGISVDHSGTNTRPSVVAGNMIYDPSNHGLSTNCYYTSISGNTVYSAGASGIVLSYGDANAVSGNVVTSSVARGLTMNNTNHNVVIGNSLQSNGTYGIYVDADSDDNTFSGNLTQGNTSGCVNIVNANCDRNQFYNNSFEEGAITNAGTNTRAWLNYDPSTNAFIATINAPTVVGGGGGALP